MDANKQELPGAEKIIEMYNTMVEGISTLNENMEIIKKFQAEIKQSQKQIQDFQAQCTRYQTETQNNQKELYSKLKESEIKCLGERNELKKIIAEAKKEYLDRTTDIKEYADYINSSKKAKDIKDDIDQLTASIDMMKIQASDFTKMVDNLKQQIGTSRNKLMEEYGEEWKDS